MIQITLTFNSIDAARRAMLELPESLLASSSLPGEDKPAVVVEKTSPKKAEQIAKPKPEAQVETTTSTAIEYPVLQKAVFTLAGKSREAAAALAGSLGVKNFKELPAEKWADALAAVQAKIAELEAA